MLTCSFYQGKVCEAAVNDRLSVGSCRCGAYIAKSIRCLRQRSLLDNLLWRFPSHAERCGYEILPQRSAHRA